MLHSNHHARDIFLDNHWSGNVTWFDPEQRVARVRVFPIPLTDKSHTSLTPENSFRDHDLFYDSSCLALRIVSGSVAYELQISSFWNNIYVQLQLLIFKSNATFNYCFCVVCYWLYWFISIYMFTMGFITLIRYDLHNHRFLPDL